MLLINFLFPGGKGPPRELDGDRALIHDFVVLMRIQRNRCWLHVNVSLREVDVIIVTITDYGDQGLMFVVCEYHLIAVGARLLRTKLKHQLLTLSHVKDTFSLVQLEAVRHFNMPFSGLLTNIADHHRLLSGVFHWHCTEIDSLWEIEKGSASDGADRDDKFLSFCYNGQIV